MGLVVGTNSWVTVAEADTYFADKFGAGAWASFPATTKEQLLISAYRWIQQQSFFSISPASTAENVKQAQMETAWYLYNYWTEHEKRRALYFQGVRNFKVSSWSEKLGMPQFPGWIKDMLEDSLVKMGGVFPEVERDFNNNSSV